MAPPSASKLKKVKNVPSAQPASWTAAQREADGADELVDRNRAVGAVVEDDTLCNRGAVERDADAAHELVDGHPIADLIHWDEV
jgi:hypothetical protein